MKKESPDQKSGFGFTERNAKSVLRSKLCFWIRRKEHIQNVLSRATQIARAVVIGCEIWKPNKKMTLIKLQMRFCWPFFVLSGLETHHKDVKELSKVSVGNLKVCAQVVNWLLPLSMAYKFGKTTYQSVQKSFPAIIRETKTKNSEKRDVRKDNVSDKFSSKLKHRLEIHLIP